MPDEKILKICRDFTRKMQTMIDRKGSKITKMTMQFGNKPPVVLAERKKTANAYGKKAPSG
jgi:hypothetical protein